MHLAKNGMDVCKIYNWLQLYFYSVANEIKWWVFEGFFFFVSKWTSQYIFVFSQCIILCRYPQVDLQRGWYEVPIKWKPQFHNGAQKKDWFINLPNRKKNPNCCSSCVQRQNQYKTVLGILKKTSACALFMGTLC